MFNDFSKIHVKDSPPVLSITVVTIFNQFSVFTAQNKQMEEKIFYRNALITRPWYKSEVIKSFIPG